MDYKRTRLWADSLGTDPKEDAQSVDRLIKAYERARENTAYILSKISKDFPSLTFHDISHVDHSGFLSLSHDAEKYKYNIMNCLQIAAERNSFVLSIIRGKDKAFSHLGGNLDALVISIH